MSYVESVSGPLKIFLSFWPRKFILRGLNNMKEQRSISVPGINLEEDSEDLETSRNNASKCLETSEQPIVRPSLFEVFMALKEREK